MAILRTENLSYLYSVGTPFETAAIKDVTIAIEPGEIVAVIGHTGSGKSTLIQHFNGLLRANEGTVYFEEKDIWENKSKIRGVRFKVGLCFQYPEYQLFEEDVYKEIAFGPKQMGLSDEEVKQRVLSALDYVGIKRATLKKSPFDLSGGQKRRVAIAGILAMEPEVLILDEPTAGLDPRGRDMVLELIRQYQHEKKNTVILVSHSMEDVAKLADRVLVMNNAGAAMFGTVPEVYSRGDELEKMGLNVPEITRIFMRLRNEKGIDCRTDIFDIEQARQEVLRLLSQRKKKGEKA